MSRLRLLRGDAFACRRRRSCPRRCCRRSGAGTMRSGTSTKSSWSLPIRRLALGRERPDHGADDLPTRMRSPSGSCAPKSSRRTVAPIRHTRLPGALLALGEAAAPVERPRARRHERRPCCPSRGRAVVAAVRRLRGACATRRRHGARAPGPRAGSRRASASSKAGASEPRRRPDALAGPDDQEVACRGSTRSAVTLRCRTGADRHHRDHRGDADDDAEHGERRAQRRCGGSRARRAGACHRASESSCALCPGARTSGTALVAPSTKANRAACVARDLGVVRDHHDRDPAFAVQARSATR